MNTKNLEHRIQKIEQLESGNKADRIHIYDSSLGPEVPEDLEGIHIFIPDNHRE